MTGSSHQRRIRRRLQERLSKRAMSEGRYLWNESVIDEPTVFCSECGQPSAIVRPGDWECRTVGCPENVADPEGVDLVPEEPIAPPEPRGEAEGGFTPEAVNKAFTLIDLANRMHKNQPPKKRRTFWNWLRKLVGR